MTPPEQRVTPSATDEMHSRLGLAFIAEAVPTLLASAAITFSGYHGPLVGFVVFVAYALFVAAALVFKVVVTPLEGLRRHVVLVQAISLAITGSLAAIFLSSDLTTLVVILSIWCAVSAATELYLGYRETNRAVTRDYLFMGGLSAIFAIIIAVIRMNDVYVVGLFGAYLAIRGVYQIIAGFSLRTSNKKPGATSATSPRTGSQ